MYLLNTIQDMSFSFRDLDAKVFCLKQSKESTRSMKPRRIRKCYRQKWHSSLESEWWFPPVCNLYGLKLDLEILLSYICILKEIREAIGIRYLTADSPTTVSWVTNLWWSFKREKDKLWRVLLLRERLERTFIRWVTAQVQYHASATYVGH